MNFKSKLIRATFALMFGLASVSSSFAGSPPSKSSGGFSKPPTAAPMRAPDPPRAPIVNNAPGGNNGFTKPPGQEVKKPDPAPPVVTAAPPVGASQQGFTKPGQPDPIKQTTAPLPGSTPQTTAVPGPAGASQQGFTKPGAAPALATTGQTAIPPKNGPPPNALAVAQTRNMSATSLTAYQNERAQAKQPPMPIAPAELRSNPVMANSRAAYGGSVDTYMARRQDTYTSFRSSNPSTFVIVHEIRPNYGIYDSGFLTGMIMGAAIGSAINNHNTEMQRAAWLNAQQNQAWYPQYMADLQRQAETNAELREKLAYMKGQQDMARQQGITANASELPPGVDASVAIAPEAVITDSNESSSQTPE